MNAFPRLSARCLGLMLLAVALRSAAQELPRPVPHDSRPEDVERDHENDELHNRAAEGFSVHLKPGERIRTEAEGERAFVAALQQRPVEIMWVKNPRTGVHNAYREDPGVPPPGTYIDGNVLMQLQQSNISVIHSGDVPFAADGWPQFVAQHPNAVVHLAGSQNADLASIQLASALGVTHLAPRTTKIFNALPQQTGRAGERERARMGVRNRATDDDAWKSVNDSIRASEPESFPGTVATREALLQELATGTSDVVVVYAHFDGKRLHLPGDPGTLAENTISVDDLAKIRRVGDAGVKERIIVLAACSTASPVEGRSLAQVLLKNGIARTVFATDKPYDARDIPGLLTRLRSQSLRQAGGQLHQYVELQMPAPGPGRGSSDL